ncbi:MAG: hypothetical protein AAFX79_08320 [Planctomycetota bacterium]
MDSGGSGISGVNSGLNAALGAGQLRLVPGQRLLVRPVGQPPVPDASQAARTTDRVDITPAAQASPATYGTTGLASTTTQGARQLIAARVSQPMDFVSGAVASRDGLPFYTNPAQANVAATRVGAASAGSALDVTA